MENLGVYETEESPNTGIRQLPRESEIEEITVHSSELMQTIKGLKTELESVKKDNERILKNSRGAESDSNRKISNRRKKQKV